MKFFIDELDLQYSFQSKWYPQDTKEYLSIFNQFLSQIAKAYRILKQVMKKILV